MSKNLGTILIVDDDRDILETARMFLKQQFETVIIDTDPSHIPDLVQQYNPDVILLDMNFKKGKNDGEEGFFWLSEILKNDQDAIVILITAYGEIDLAVKAMKKGATDFILKPWKNQKLLGTILSALELRRSRLEVGKLKNTQQKLSADINRNFGELVGSSPPMVRVYDLINKVADTDANVLILGDNGTGKELVARALHKQSSRCDQPFISVDIGALSENLFESELFGHMKGAFTDAKETRIGSFEMASGGTLFLDEIGNIPSGLQIKLLSAIQNKKIRKVGDNREISVDIRLICATNMPIYELVDDGSFRQDLLYRINTVEINLPPLKARLQDIDELLPYFLNLYGNKYKKQLKADKKIIDNLKKYNWPGNVRELQHAVERAVIMCDNDYLTPDHFFPGKMEESTSFKLDDKTLDGMEKAFIIQSLAENSGNVTKTANVLGLTRTALYRRLKKYGIKDY